MRSSRLGVVAGAALLAWTSQAHAIVETHWYKAEGQFSIQPAFQHKNGSDVDYVQQRQELRLGLTFKQVRETDQNSFFKKWEWALLWRGRYDAIFDIRSNYRDRDYDRNDFRFPEGDRPREFYADIGFRGFLEPLSLRIGRQQLVWGEADFFRSLDVVNPLRLDQMGLVGDDLDNYREPLWIAKALWHFGDFPGVSSVDLEGFFSADGRPLTDKLVLGNGWRIHEPGSGCYPDRIDCKRPHDQPFSRVRHPWEIERVGPDHDNAPDQGDLGLENLRQGLGLPFLGNDGGLGKADFIYLGHNAGYGDRADLGDEPYRDLGNLERIMAGVRLLGQTSFGGVYFTLNYMWKRVEVPAPGVGWSDLFSPAINGNGGFNLRPDIAARSTAALLSPDLNGNGIPDGNEALAMSCMRDGNSELILGPSVTGNRTLYGYAFPTESVGAACVPISLKYPHTHIVGFTMTYNDFDYTGAILRTEQSLSTKEPRTIFPALLGTRAGQFPTDRDFDTGGHTQTQVWRSMVGFDYLRSMFQHHDLPRWMYNKQLIRSLLTDQWFLTFQFFNEYWAHVSHQLGQDFSATNRHQHFNPILTWIQTGFFMNQKLRPTIALAYDVNAKFPVAWLQVQYQLRPDLQIRIGEVNYMGSRHAESFLFLNKYADRDTTYIRLTYFFL